MNAPLAKRTAAFFLVLVSGAAVAGCPVYSDYDNRYAYCYHDIECRIGEVCTWDGFCVPGKRADVDGGSADGGAAGSHSDAVAPVDAARAADDAANPDEGGVDASVFEGAVAPPMADGVTPIYCAGPNDCAAVQTCAADGTCHPGDCTSQACINQFQCTVTLNGPACVHGESRACAEDRQCATNDRCVDGRCTVPAFLCSDRSQCPAGKLCVAGKCMAGCTADPQCPTGFLCRTALGICDTAAKTCTRTSDCGGKETVCIDHACVPRCTQSGVCATGTCVDNGCIPSQGFIDQCTGDGSPSGCQAGHVCLHHHCYLSCQSPAVTACDATPATPLCKTVTVMGNAYSICGTTQTLGSECDPTVPKACADAKVCIDGFCR